MENFCLDNELSFDNIELNDMLNDLRRCFNLRQNTFCSTCFCVYSICSYFDHNYVGKEKKTNEYYDKYKLLGKFGFSKTEIKNMRNCYIRFMIGDNAFDVKLKSIYFGFSPSKLFVLLSIGDVTLEDCIDKKLITPQMTVKEIREYIKSLKAGDKKTETVIENEQDINEEEIPMAYDPKKHYNFDYFDSLSKKQLVNAIWELQNYVEKLKTKSVKTTSKKSTKKVA